MIFENKQYTTIMYLAILIASLLILFNFINIFKNNNEKNSFVTGLTTHNINDTNKTDFEKEDKKEELYTTKSYFIYYIILTVLGCSIIALSFRYLIPVLKRYS